MTGKPSEWDVINANAAIHQACLTLFNSAVAEGLSVKPPPVMKRPDDDILARSDALAAYHDSVSAQLANHRAGTTSAGQSAASPGAGSGVDMGTMLSRLQERCALLVGQLKAAGCQVPAPPHESGGLLSDFVSATNFHEQLLFHARNLPKSAAASSSSGASAALAVPNQPAAAVSTPAPHVAARLTTEEIKAMNWTERAQFSGGHMTIEQVRAAIASRTAAKSEKSKSPNWTQRALHAKTAEVRNPAAFPNLD